MIVEPRYAALIGDIRASRELEDRAAGQARFRALVDELNDRIDDAWIASPFTITTGDEFQGLVTDPAGAVEAMVLATERFWPHQLRFGLGWGPLDTEVNEEQAIGMDGPCFHHARSALERAAASDRWLRIENFDPALDRPLEAFIDLVADIRAGWTDRQREFALALRETATQKEVAERFGVQPSTVSESLTAGHVRDVHQAEQALADILQHAVGRGEGEP